MDEKFIVKSERFDKAMKIVTIAIVVIGLIISVAWVGQKVSWYADKYNSTSYIDWSDNYSSPLDMAMSQDGGFWLVILPFLISIGLAAIVYFAYSKIELTVTNKRVYGYAIFGKRVDLPIDSISAIGTNILKGVDVTTASGAIKFICIKNSDTIHREISTLLVERQSNKEEKITTIVKETSESSADEIAKYKTLLDSGAITEEEYNEKKKQLLGL